MTDLQRPLTDDYVEFAHAGTPVKGVFECASCGHRVTTTRTLPECADCGESLWERADWSPFGDLAERLRARLV